MFALIKSIIGLFLVAPLIFIIIFFFCINYWKKNAKLAARMTADFSTIILIFSVHFLILTIWEVDFFIYVYLILFLIFIVTVYSIRKLNGKLKVVKSIRTFWRMNFLLFLALYCILMFIGLVSSAFTYLAAANTYNWK